jgi:hypothetical protein
MRTEPYERPTNIGHGTCIRQYYRYFGLLQYREWLSRDLANTLEDRQLYNLCKQKQQTENTFAGSLHHIIYLIMKALSQYNE